MTNIFWFWWPLFNVIFSLDNNNNINNERKSWKKCHFLEIHLFKKMKKKSKEKELKNNIFFHWHDPYFFHKYWIGKINFFRSLTIRDSLDLPIGKKSVCIWFIRIFISFCFTFFFQLKNGWILKQNFVHRIFFFVLFFLTIFRR